MIAEKIKNATYILGASCGLICDKLGLSQEIITILLVMIILDTITGIIKSLRLYDKITSNRLSIGILSKLILILMPLTISLVGLGVGINLNLLVIGSLNVLILSEGYSVLANIYMTKTGIKLKEQDAISEMLLSVMKVLKKIIKSID